MAIDNYPRITVNEFASTIGTPADGKVVTVKIGADWCPPCQLFDREVQSLIAAYVGRVSFVHVDGDRIPSGTPQSRDFKRVIKGYETYPTIVVFRGGQQVAKVIGYDVEKLRRELDRVLKVE